jgi:hypothetical protein
MPTFIDGEQQIAVGREGDAGNVLARFERKCTGLVAAVSNTQLSGAVSRQTRGVSRPCSPDEVED